MKMASIRQVYGEKLAELGGKIPEMIVIDADVSISTRSAIFGSQFPDRFFNFGVAEANMVSAAAGISTFGLIPVVNTFSLFICKRALDQVRADIAYNKLNVKLAGNYGGVSCHREGASHHAYSDIAIMRSIPEMTVVVISDGVCMEKALEPIIRYDGPVFFRLHRDETEIIHGEDFEFNLGKGVLIRDGTDITLFACGPMLVNTIRAADMLSEKNINARIVEIHTIKPIDEDIIVESARKTGTILTCEEANVIGGLGGAVAEVLGRRYPVKMDMVGFQDKFAESGSHEELIEKYGMSARAIADKAKALCFRK